MPNTWGIKLFGANPKDWESLASSGKNVSSGSPGALEVGFPRQKTSSLSYEKILMRKGILLNYFILLIPFFLFAILKIKFEFNFCDCLAKCLASGKHLYSCIL